MAFKDLKKNREDLRKRIDQQIDEDENKFKDDRFWRPTLDKAKNGRATIRFLPPCEGEELPWAKVFKHAFQVDGRWYIENCLTTLEKDDPCVEHASILWNSGSEANKNIARTRGRKKRYISNVFVVNDPADQENNGKVFLFEYGQTIMDKIILAKKPKFDDIEAVDPFDMWDGADFNLRIMEKDNNINYDESSFTTPKALADDEELEKIYDSLYPLLPFIAEDQFKTYEELEKRLDFVLNGPKKKKKVSEDEQDDPPVEDEDQDDVPVEEKPKRKFQTKETVSEDDEKNDEDESDEDDSETSDNSAVLDKFRKKFGKSTK